MNLDVKTFNAIRKIVKEQSGINLGTNKEALVSARVGKRMRQLSISRYDDYLQTLLEDKSREKPLFGPKYWFGYGTSYYASVYFRF